MSTNSDNTSRNVLLAIILIAGAAIYRILPHPPNVAPITAIALFGGAYLNRKWLIFLVPFIALYASDFVLNNTVLRSWYPDVEGTVFWSQYMTGTFLAFGLIICLGLLFLKKVSALKVVSVSLVSSILFFLVTNFFVWFASPTYPQSLSGLLACYGAGIPFFRPTILGDLLFTGVLFGAMELIKTKFYTSQTAAA